MSSTADSEPEQRPTDGLVAGKYEILRLIGRGGMGSVWEARHVSLGTKVAIKFVEVEHAKNAEARDRFQNEARAAASIQSKHAIKVYDHGLLEDGRPYIVMEMLIGEPLDSRIALLGTLPIQETARMVMQVARALQQAHDAGITHRDLKPENIFLVRNPDDDDEMAKVLDFGIAKLTDASHALAVSSSTKTGVLMGTPYYMSPEQARGLKTLDYRSDLWALGVIVFRCVTGALPFKGEALGDLLVKICASPVPAPSSVLPGLSAQLDAWMVRALQREPQDRFQSATEMAESLAMVAGVSVRLPSRRSYDPVANAPTAAVTPLLQSGGSNASPFAGTKEVLSRPVPVVTSSPTTASSHPIALGSGEGGFSATAVSAFALVGLLVAGGVTYLTVRPRTTGVTPDVVAADAPPSSATAKPAASAPVAMPSAEPPPAAITTASAAPTAEPPKVVTTSHRSTARQPPAPVVASPAPPPPPPAPPPPRPARPAAPSGNDPGY